MDDGLIIGGVTGARAEVLQRLRLVDDAKGPVGDADTGRAHFDGGYSDWEDGQV